MTGRRSWFLESRPPLFVNGLLIHLLLIRLAKRLVLRRRRRQHAPENVVLLIWLVSDMSSNPEKWGFSGTITPGSPTTWDLNPEQYFSVPMPGRLNRIIPGERLVLPSIPEAFCPLVGAVVAYWGEFETRMDSLLAAFVIADNDPNDAKWRRIGFERRRELLKRKVKKRFPGPVAEAVSAILGAARVYYWQRNLIVHGHFMLKIDHGRAYPIAYGYVKDEYVELPLNEEFLERMYHELGMLSGRIQDIIDGEMPLPLHETQTIKALAQKARENPPTHRNVQPLHPAWPALSPRPPRP